MFIENKYLASSVKSRIFNLRYIFHSAIITKSLHVHGGNFFFFFVSM